MKQSPTVALIIGALSCALYLQPAGAANDEQPTQRKAAAAAKKEPTAMTFGGYPCPAAGCAEDKAGWEWAARNRIRDPDDCTGMTAAFIEGCRVYAQQQALLPVD
jgi:hypothetical protein